MVLCDVIRHVCYVIKHVCDVIRHVCDVTASFLPSLTSRVVFSLTSDRTSMT